MAGWSWNPQERFAYGPGVHCFVAGQEYAHGGVSLQECVVPFMTVTSSVPTAAVVVTLAEVRWVGLRCRVRTDPAVDNLRVDLRTKPNVPGSSITQPKVVDDEGKAALLVEDESLEGAIVSLVFLDEAGHVVCKEPTTVGGEG